MKRVHLVTMLGLCDEVGEELLNEYPKARRALGALYELRLLLTAESMVPKEPDKPLPPMIDPATGDAKPKRVKSKDVGCPRCKARPGQPCLRLTTRGHSGVPTDQPLLDGNGKPQYHTARYREAQWKRGK